MNPITRRQFIAAGGMLTLGTAIACSSGSPKATASGTPSPGTFDAILGDRVPSIQIITVGTEALSGRPERIAIAMLTPEGVGIVGATGNLWLAQQRTAPALGPFPIRHIAGAVADRGVYETTATIPEDGIWFLIVEASVPGESGTKIGVANTLQIGKTNDMPKPGDRAISVPTPTTRKPRGVDPICTADPICSMHAISLDDALRNGKPTVLTIATPRFCTSRFCGPVVQTVDGVKAETSGVNFVHVEVLRDDEDATVQAFQGARPEGFKGNPLAPAAIAYNLAEEPVVYYIDAKGVIIDRQLSAVDDVDVRAGIDQIRG